jgi:hypothetical protein
MILPQNEVDGLFSTVEEQMVFKDILRNNVVSVTFIKKDGTERKMKCTLKEDLLPVSLSNNLETEALANTKVRMSSTDVLPVYDIEANGWRSFRWDSVVAVE